MKLQPTCHCGCCKVCRARQARWRFYHAHAEQVSLINYYRYTKARRQREKTGEPPPDRNRPGPKSSERQRPVPKAAGVRKTREPRISDAAMDRMASEWLEKIR
jgi:hypothetical protein